jgi:hypothetical protein
LFQFVLGVLAIFVILDSHNSLKSGDEFTKKALWTQPVRIQTVTIVLSTAYWALILFGVQSYLARRLFEGIVGRYRKKMNEESYYDDIRAMAKEKNCQGRLITKRKTGIEDYTQFWYPS